MQFDIRLRQALKEWTEIDVAAFNVAQSLGIAPPPKPELGAYGFGDKKWIFWTENPMGAMLFDLLEKMTVLGILETHENDPHLYRWNACFNWDEL